MKKICLVVAALLISSFLLFDVHVSSASPDPTLRDYYNTDDDSNGWGADDTHSYAQTFTVGNDPYSITSIVLKVYRVGNPGIITISIRRANGHPWEDTLTYSKFDGDNLPTSATWCEFEIPEYPLQEDTSYAIILSVPSGSVDNEVFWRCDHSSPTYDGGRYLSKLEPDGSWVAFTGDDHMFEVWGNDNITWWDNNWEYRVPIILEPHTENYQHRLFLDMTDNLGDDARSDFQDLRIISADENILPIWRENWNENENVKLWYRKPENTYTYAWLYYGNAVALHTDNGNNVFVLFDNFDGTTLNMSKWDNVVGAASIDNSIVTLENDAWETFRSDISFSTPIIVRAMIKLKGVNSGFGFMDDVFDYPMVYFTDSDPVGTHRTVSGNDAAQVTVIPVASDTWHTYEIRHQTNPQTFYIDDNLEATHSDQDVSDPLPIHFASRTSSQYLYMNWMLLRRFVVTEPTATLGNASSYNAPPSTPTELTLNAPIVGENLIAEASGSTDNESITYYYSFYNQTDAVMRQGYSIENTYTIVPADVHDNLRVFARAYDGEGYSDNFENSIIVTNRPPTVPTDHTLLGIDENNTPVITWTKGTDNDGDTVTTVIYLGENAVPTEVDNSTTGETFTLGENASHSTYPLENGNTYYYRLRSWDGYEYSSYTMADEFEVATENIATLNPIDDSYVYAGSTSSNYGASVALYVITLDDGLAKNYRSFLMFDLSSIPSDVEIYSATLRLYCAEVLNMNAAAYVELRQVWDDNWSEENITWANQPTYLGYVDSAYSTEPVVGWIEWDILTYTIQEYDRRVTGDNDISMMLKCSTESYDGVLRGSWSWSSEGTYLPELVITYGEPTPPEWENVIITSTVGGTTTPPVDNYLYEKSLPITLIATADFGYEFDHWEVSVPEYEWYENITESTFGTSITAESFFYAVFTGSAPPTILSLFPTILAVAISIMFAAVGFGIGKGNPTIGIMFLLVGIMMVSIMGLLPEWFFIIPLIAFCFFTLWRFSGSRRSEAL